MGGACEVGPAADIHALGAILYELLTGRPPFLDRSLLELVMQLRDRDPVPPRSLVPATPRDLETICLHRLRKDPKQAATPSAAEALPRRPAPLPGGRADPRLRPVGLLGRATALVPSATRWWPRIDRVLVVAVVLAGFFGSITAADGPGSRNRARRQGQHERGKRTRPKKLERRPESSAHPVGQSRLSSRSAHGRGEPRARRRCPLDAAGH